MADRPILFSASMAQAVLVGEKTQARSPAGLRTVNTNPDIWERAHVGELDYMTKRSVRGKYGATFISRLGSLAERTISVCPAICPFGPPSSLLWVREPWGIAQVYTPTTPVREKVVYKADFPDDYDMFGIAGHCWHPSVHMCRKDSRITLEITNVRMERLNDISEADALAEGMATLNLGMEHAPNWSAKLAFEEFWEASHPGSWNQNPWVWAIEFRVLAPAPCLNSKQ